LPSCGDRIDAIAWHESRDHYGADTMTEHIEPGAKPDPERLRVVSTRPQASLDRNFFHAVDQLRTSVEGMDVALHGIDLDRSIFPDSNSDQEARRRWAAHLVLMRNLFGDIERRVRDIHADVVKAFPID
jgi:hypothetical protein